MEEGDEKFVNKLDCSLQVLAKTQTRDMKTASAKVGTLSSPMSQFRGQEGIYAFFGVHFSS